jgi:hypothetical protein
LVERADGYESKSGFEIALDKDCPPSHLSDYPESVLEGFVLDRPVMLRDTIVDRSTWWCGEIVDLPPISDFTCSLLGCESQRGDIMVRRQWVDDASPMESEVLRDVVVEYAGLWKGRSVILEIDLNISGAFVA